MSPVSLKDWYFHDFLAHGWRRAASIASASGTGTGAAPMTSPLTLCADDFGQSEAIVQAILELAGRRRINATTVMVDGPEAQAGAAALARIEHVSVGPARHFE